MRTKVDTTEMLKERRIIKTRIRRKESPTTVRVTKIKVPNVMFVRSMEICHMIVQRILNHQVTIIIGEIIEVSIQDPVRRIPLAVKPPQRQMKNDQRAQRKKIIDQEEE